MWFMLCLWSLLPANELKVEVLRTYGEVPGAKEVFIQRPGDLSLDDMGRLHVLDLVGRNLLVWDKSGSFVGAYGKPGQGPGELQISGSMGGPQGYVTSLGDTIYVYDGGARRLSLFNADLSFREAVPFNLEGGRVEAFHPLGKDAFLVFNSSYLSDVPFRKIAIFNRAKTSENIIAKAPDTTWRYSGSGQNRRVELQAFSPQTLVTINHASGKIIIADSSKAGFNVYDLKGKQLKTVAVKLGQKAVTPELKEEFSSQNYIKNSNGFFSAAFPEKRAFFEQILPVGKQRYLLYLISPVLANVEGYLVNESGETLGRFTYACGEGGALFSSRGRIFSCSTDSDGEYTIQELSIGGKEKAGEGE